MRYDPADPAYDDQRYCESCLALLSYDWLAEHDHEESVDCPHCDSPIYRAMRHDDMTIERAIRAADSAYRCRRA